MKPHAIQTDSKGRLNLGQDYASSYFLIEEKEEGEFSLKRATIVPDNELWLYKNKKALDSVLRGIEQARNNKLEKNAIDLDQFED